VSSEKSVVVQELLDLISTNVTVLVLIQSLEAFVLIEQRSSGQLLSDAFGVSNVADDSLEGLLQQEDGLVTENLVQRNVFSVGRNSLAQNLSVAGILGGQDLAETVESEDSFVVSVVFLQQQGDLIISWEDAELVEGLLDLRSANETLAFDVEESEGVQEVEVSSNGEINLDVLQILVEVDLLVQGGGEVLLFVTLHW